MTSNRVEVAVVTGGGSGIGMAISKALADRGATVICCDRSKEAVARTVSSIQETGGTGEGVVADVRDEPAMKAMVQDVVDRFGHIDLLVCAAGVATIGSAETTSAHAWRRLVDVNLIGTVVSTRAAFAAMAKAKSGHIIHIGSLASFLPAPGLAAYAASKAAVRLYSESFYWEAKAAGVHVTLACPGYVRTNLFTAADATDISAGRFLKGIPFRMLEPGEAAERILDAAAKRRRVIVFPFYAKALSAIHQLFPRLLFPLYEKMVGDLFGRRREGTREREKGRENGQDARRDLPTASASGHSSSAISNR